MLRIKRQICVDVLCASRKARATRRAFTLLEILLVLALMAVVLGGLAATIKLFSNNYAANERRVGRAQLARSISQMLSDDLGAAIQDPVQNVAEDPNRQFVRHFGLRGDERSLQIDVVQPNLFATVATAEENKRVSTGADKSSKTKQAPELKTVFYEFVPINSVEVLEGDDEEGSGANTGDDASVSLGGSLTSVDGDLTFSLDDSSDVMKSFLDGTRPLAQKFGLSRRELDYETPDENEDAESDAMVGGVAIDPESGAPVSTLSGSLTSTPDVANSTLASGANSLSPVGGNEDEANVRKEPMTAAQIAMDADDGTTWAPEVLDCRFSYFDGTDWLTSWDSIEKNGLPVAIKVELKLAPLDDVDLYRASPLLFSLPVPPELSEIAKLSEEDEASDDDGASKLAGSLTQTPDEAKRGEPIDVFNSYRPLSSIRAALRGVTPTPASSASLVAETKSIDSTNNAAETSTDEETGGELTGGLSGSAFESPNALDDASVELTSGESSVNSLASVAQALASRGVVYNEAGVCVDFANLGGYTTLEKMASEIGVSEPIVYEVVAYLPTTPYSRAKTLERRKPTVARAGNVATRQTRNASSRERRASGANPYATGRARQIQERRVNERTVSDRAPRGRQRNERDPASRRSQNRNIASREAGESPRLPAGRETRNRTNRTRATTTRQTRERAGAGGGRTETPIDEGLAAALKAEGGVLGAEVNVPNAGGAASASPTFEASGALGGTAAPSMESATPINGLDPFEIVDSSLGDVPFAGAGSEFDAVDSAGVGLAPGLIESPTGDINVVTSQTSIPEPQKKQQQTWIRGKK